MHGLPPLPASRPHPHPPDGSHAGPHTQHGNHLAPHHHGSRRPPHEDLLPSGPPPRPRRMEPEAQWITRGGTGGVASYGAGSAYAGSFGGSHAGTSGSGGGGTGTGFDGGRWASSSGGGGNQTASSSGGASEPGVDRRFHDSFNSHRSPGKMPDYLKASWEMVLLRWAWLGLYSGAALPCGCACLEFVVALDLRPCVHAACRGVSHVPAVPYHGLLRAAQVYTVPKDVQYEVSS